MCVETSAAQPVLGKRNKNEEPDTPSIADLVAADLKKAEVKEKTKHDVPALSDVGTFWKRAAWDT